MSFQTAYFSELSGLSYDKNEHLFWGMHEEYQVYLSYLPRRNVLVFTLSGKLPPEADEQETGAMLRTWYTARPGITALTHQRGRLTCTISVAARNSESEAYARVRELTSLAAELGLIPCCTCCGAEGIHTPYILDGSGETVCSGCRSAVEYKIAEAEMNASRERPNTAGIVIGAVIGGFSVLLLTLLGLQLGRISVLTAFAGLLLGFLAMRKFGKKLTLRAAVLCSALCLIAGCSALWIHFPNEIAKYNQENKAKAEEILSARKALETTLDSFSGLLGEYGDLLTPEAMDIDWEEVEANCALANVILEHQSVGSCRRDFDTLTKMEHYRSVRSDLYDCIIWTVISVLAGTVVIARPMLKIDSGKHTFKALA